MHERCLAQSYKKLDIIIILYFQCLAYSVTTYVPRIYLVQTCTDNVHVPSGLIAFALTRNRLGSMGQLSQFLHLSNGKINCILNSVIYKYRPDLFQELKDNIKGKRALIAWRVRVARKIWHIIQSVKFR